MSLFSLSGISKNNKKIGRSPREGNDLPSGKQGIRLSKKDSKTEQREFGSVDHSVNGRRKKKETDELDVRQNARWRPVFYLLLTIKLKI